MIFRRKAPDPPSITDEKSYVAWFVEYSDELAWIRKLYSHNISAYVDACTRGTLKELSKHPDGDSLFARVGDLAVYYEKEMKPLVAKRGGLHRCPPQLQGAAVSMIVNITVMNEFLKKKFKHAEALALFDEIEKLP